MAIFHHQDCDGDAVELLADTDDPQEDLVLLFSSRTGERAGGVRIDRDAALHLHMTLGEWLYPTHTPEAKNRSLIEQMIEKAVKDQVAAILPLHMTPGASFRISGPCAGHVDGGRDHDPEPGDVGHPRPAEPEPVAEPHFPSLHMATESECRAAGCAAARHLSEPAPQHGRLMAELPRRTRNRMWRPEDSWPRPPQGPCDERPPVGAMIAHVHDCGYVWGAHRTSDAVTLKCPECLHGWMEHTSSMCWGGGNGPGLGRDACDCTRERP